MINRAIAIGGALAAIAFSLPSTASAGTIITRQRSFGQPGAVSPIGTGARNTFPNIAQGLTRIGARYLGPVSLGNRVITLHVQTALRNDAALHAYAQMASTPGSVYYRRWLTPSSIAASFGTPKAQYDATAAYFASQGMHVGKWKTRTALSLSGTQAQIETAFGTKLGTFSLRRDRFFAPIRPLSLPVSVNVSGISPITNAKRVHVTSMPGGPPEQINGGFSNARVNGVTANQLAEAYDLNEAYAKGYTGKGINLGIIGTGPISLNDFPFYRSLFNIPGSSTVAIQPVTVDGDTTPPTVTGPCTAGTSTAPVAGCNPEDVEAQLDTEQTAGLARDASVLFYLAYNASAGEQGLDEADDELLQAIDDNKADILSLSYGGCEILDTALFSLTPVPLGDATGTDPTMFAELASEGIATFVSSGDSGSAACQRAVGGVDAPNVSYPSGDPNVVSVGGTTTPIGGNGRLTGPITNWGQQTQSGGAAGAGTSVDFQTPSFQKAQTAVAALCTMRCQPDVALNADPFTGPAVIYDSTAALGGPSDVPEGGTSASAPDTAAMWAVVLSACRVTASCMGPTTQPVTDPVSGYTAPAAPRYRLGNPNFLLYPILKTPTTYHSVFYDIVYGNDGVPPYAVATAAGEAGISAYTAGIDPGAVSAGPGFDVASGLGFPLGYQLLKFVVPGAN